MSVYIKHIIKTIKSLVLADKFIFLGSIITILGLFLPWFSINLSDLYTEDAKLINAFTGIAYIIGYLCYTFTIIALNTIDKKLSILIACLSFILFLSVIFFNKIEEGLTMFSAFLFFLLNLVLLFIMNNIKNIKKIKKHILNLFAGLENLILVFTASMIYHKESLEFTSANLSFGIYISLIGALLIVYGGYLQMKINQKTNVKELFSVPKNETHSGVNLKPDLNIDKSETNQNNKKAEQENSQLSFGDYE